MIYNSLQKTIITYLLRYQEVASESFFAKNSYNPFDYLQSCSELQKHGLINISDDWKLSRAPQFLENVIRERHKIFNRSPNWKRRGREEIDNRQGGTKYQGSGAGR